jgi:NTP pyrophosphatase (non-canonical NTP hydrolase)
LSLNELANAIYHNNCRKGFWGAEAKQHADGNWAQLRSPDGWGRNFGELLMLVVSEAAEALEHWRDGQQVGQTLWSVTMHPGDAERLGLPERYEPRVLKDWASTEAGRQRLRAAGANVKPDGIPSELADILIRVLDICTAFGIDIDTVVRAKAQYNATRPELHGRAR